MNKVPHLLAVLALAAPTTAAFAEEKAVSYSDLNLATPEGQAALETRITTALEDVCGVNSVQTGTRIKSRGAKRCMAEARAKAKQQVAAILEQKGLGG